MPGGSPPVEAPSALSRLYRFFTTKESSPAVQPVKAVKKQAGLNEALLSGDEQQAGDGPEASQGGYEPPKGPGQ